MEENKKSSFARAISRIIDIVSVASTIAMLALAIYNYAIDRLDTISLICVIILALTYVIARIFRANAESPHRQKTKNINH